MPAAGQGGVAVAAGAEGAGSGDGDADRGIVAAAPVAAAGADVRQRILDTVARQPGISIRELADALGLWRTSVVHHLRILGRQRQLRTVRNGRSVLVFAAAHSPFDGMVGMVRMRMVQRLIQAIEGEPATSVKGLARSLGITPKAVRYHVLRLQRLGLLARPVTPLGRRRFVLAPQALDMLRRLEGMSGLPARLQQAGAAPLPVPLGPGQSS